MNFSCRHCGFAVPFEEEDRGTDVYCPSCGLVNRAPAEAESPQAEETGAAQATEPEMPPSDEASTASESAGSYVDGNIDASSLPTPDSVVVVPAPSSADRPVSVFSTSGTNEVLDRVTGEETCLCGVKVPVRVEDFGGVVYCPSCGTEIRVGATLDRGKYRTAESAAETPSGPTLPRPVRRRRLRISIAAVGTSIVLLAAAALGVYLTNNHPEAVRQMAQDMGFLPDVSTTTGPAGPIDPMAEKRQPLPITPELIEKLRKHPKPANALILARRWLARLRNDRAVSADDPRLSALTEIIKNLEKELAPPLNMEMIAYLLKSDDLGAALVQAQMWQEYLRDEKVPKTDPRTLKLEQVIAELTRRLTPKPKEPPPYIAEFQQFVQELAEKLKQEDWKLARHALDQAEQLLRDHPEQLAPFGRRLLVLKQRLAEHEAQVSGTEQIRTELRLAGQSLAAGRVVEGIEQIAHAKFSAFKTPLTPEEIKEFDSTVRSLLPEVRFARGKRAVEEAEACQKAGDRLGRDAAVLQAQSLLPGLPESRIALLIERIRPWAEDAAKKSANLPKPGTPSARQTERRAFYETALDQYGNGQYEELAATCVRIEAISTPPGEETQKMHDRLGAMLFDVLEWKIGRLLLPESRDNATADQNEELFKLRKSLDDLTPWRKESRWLILDAALREHGEKTAKQYLERAKTLAAEDRLAEAAAEAERAAAIGGDATRPRAEELRAQCQAEIKLRADRRAEQESWKQISSFRNQAGKEWELWRELQQYSRRFPKGEHAAEIQPLLTKTQQTIQQKAARAVAEIEQLIKEKHWSDARKKMKMIQDSPLPDAQKETVEKLKVRFQELTQDAKAKLLLLDRQKKLFTEDDVLVVLKELPEIIAMDPDNTDAREIMSRARIQGELRAQKLLNTALMFKDIKPEIYREKLQRIVMLSPDGPLGRQARELLQE